jgi:DNA-binding HxlR family transcriptional regulator
LDPNSGFAGSHNHSQCKAELALKAIQGRWKLQILRELLEADGVIARTVFPEVPPRVDYALTEFGRELMPVLEGLHAWGERAEQRRGD